MKNASKILVCAAVIFIFFLSACATTKLTEVWKDKSYTGGSLKSVMVLGLTENDKTRKMFEDAFSNQFKSRGVEAVASLDAISEDMKLTLDNVKSHKEIIKSAAAKHGMETVLITHLAGIDEKEVYYPGSHDPMSPGIADFGSFYADAFTATYTPGRYATHKYVRLASSLYDVETEKLIWFAQSQHVDPKSVNEMIEALGKAVMKSLRSNNLIP
ncbi:MAG: hypothetical protein JRI75_05285 [Deltaproteobacteria bacterium]|nr:hypothetical protein [Deltaproteobacteria bacterium]